MGKHYTLIEYDYLSFDKLDTKEMQEIESFVLENPELLTIAYKRGIGKMIKTRNYVGVIQTRCGTIIEILPKIYNRTGEMSHLKTRQIFLSMLRTLRDSPFKSLNISNVRTEHMHLFDIFIKMFLDETNKLFKRGLKSDYERIEENITSFKGKLLMTKHVRENPVHKERFYVTYDDYNRNRPENRIIKSTLLFLKGRTRSLELTGMMDKFLFNMDDIEASGSIDKDLMRCSTGRLMDDYNLVLKWCRVFLKKESFTSFQGDSDAIAILFPMERLFENYVAKAICQNEEYQKYRIKTQDKQFYLINKPKRFLLKPDIVLEEGSKYIILDTKWKLLNDSERDNYNISQGDLYQMYAYGKKYGAQKLVLLYPLNDKVRNICETIEYCYEQGIKLIVWFVDLEDVESSLRGLHMVIDV